MTEQSGAKKVVVLLGSPRKQGNSALLAQRIVQGAEAAGAGVETFYLNGMNIRPCQSCYACQKKDSKGCAVDDDMQILYPKLVEASAWVIASPVFWFTMSAQTKLFMDRCFALMAYGPEAFRKRIAIAMTFGDTDPFTSGCVNALRTFQDCFRYVGAKITGMVYGSAMEAGQIESNASVLAQAEALGRKLVE
ncbi:MAG: flavodoxin family protein [Proteobacteria bacterium]|nr:flavodoxin family protein [Pseudomonadota bacterium]